jgi:hypothetical protein
MYDASRYSHDHAHYSLLFLAQIENSIAKEPKIQPTQLKQRSLSGNQDMLTTHSPLMSKLPLTL